MNECKLPIPPGLDKIQPYQPGKPVAEVEREFGVANAIKLASNENPLGPSSRVKAAVRANLKLLNIYPDGACFHLRQALAKRLKVNPEEIILGNGSNELLVLLGRCFVRPEDEVLTSQLSFVVYSLVAHMQNATLVTVPMQNFTFDLDAMLQAITPRTRIVYLCNPNNPTGTCVRPEALQPFIQCVPESCLVVLDEAYFEYMDKAMQPDSLTWVRQYKNVVMLRTFSKAYGLAGLRVGYGVASMEVAQLVNKVRDPFNVNGLAQIAAQAAWQDQAHMRKSVRLAQRERKRISRLLAQPLGLTVADSQTNFIFVHIPGTDGKELADRLLRQGVIVRPFPGPYIRITLGTVAQNNKMLKALKTILK